jgi:hypothetical protein
VNHSQLKGLMEKAITEQQPSTKSRHQTALLSRNNSELINVHYFCLFSMLKGNSFARIMELMGTEFYDLSGKTQKHVFVRFVYICVLVFMLCKRGNIKECAQNPQEANSPQDN